MKLAPFMNIQLERTMNRAVFFLLGVACTLVVGCTDSTNRASPTLPSPFGTASTRITSLTDTSATVTGVVRDMTIQPALMGTRPSDTAPLRVIVLGTSLSTEVNTSGQFTFEGVPAGFVGLAFEGPGVDAPLGLGSLEPGQHLQIVVTVNGSTASVADVRGRRENNGRRSEVQVASELGFIWIDVQLSVCAFGIVIVENREVLGLELGILFHFRLNIVVMLVHCVLS